MDTQKVVIEDAEKPIPVILEDKGKKLVNKSEGRTLEPTTTEQEDITKASQRRINLIWEHTQAAIAVSVTIFTMLAGTLVTVANVFWDKKELQLPTIFAVGFGTVIGFYFSRTNHQNIGGVGSQKQEGR